MQQRVGRVVTADGTGVSYSSVGAGRPLVYVMGWLSHLRAELGAAGGAGVLRVVGPGMPARALRPGRLRAVGRDGQAAVTGVRARPAGRRRRGARSSAVRPDGDVDGGVGGGGVGGERIPETVRRLVLYGGWARGAELSPPTVRNHVLGLIESHWGLGSDVLTDIFAPDADRSARAEFGRYQRACSSAATARALLALSYELDVGDLLGRRPRADAGRAPRATTAPRRRRRPRRSPPASAVPSSCCCRAARTSRTPATRTRWCASSVASSASPRPDVALDVLTARQREVAGLVSAGLHEPRDRRRGWASTSGRPRVTSSGSASDWGSGRGPRWPPGTSLTATAPERSTELG